MGLSDKERQRYRSKRLRHGKNRVVSPENATPRREPNGKIEGMNCSCGVHLEGTPRDFEEHWRWLHPGERSPFFF